MLGHGIARCTPESLLLRGRSAPSMGTCPGGGHQLTRDSAANVAVVPLWWVVALAALGGAEGSPLLAAQAAAAPREGRGVGARLHPAHGPAGLPAGCCRDTTESSCRGREKWVQILDQVPREQKCSCSHPGTLGSRSKAQFLCSAPKMAPGMLVRREEPAADVLPGSQELLWTSRTAPERLQGTETHHQFDPLLLFGVDRPDPIWSQWAAPAQGSQVGGKTPKTKSHTFERCSLPTLQPQGTAAPYLVLLAAFWLVSLLTPQARRASHPGWRN